MALRDSVKALGRIPCPAEIDLGIGGVTDVLRYLADN